MQIIKTKHIDRTMFDQSDRTDYISKATRGLSKALIRKISREKRESYWMLQKRLKALEIFHTLSLPSFGPSLRHLDLDKIIYYAVAHEGKQATSWDEVPQHIKNTFERLGIPQAEREMLAGVGAQYESTMVYHRLKENWEKQGVIFEDMDVALQKHEMLVKRYFMKCIPPNDHKFAALHGAVWSGGTFLYVPKNVKVEIPLQAYFRMNAPFMGQFEHTLIIIEDGAQAHYIEGCSAPKYGKIALHAGCVEIYVGKNARFRYSSVENWSKDTFNLNTKRALVKKNSIMEWVSGNMGSGVTMLYPCSVLLGEGAKAEHLGFAFAGPDQIQDTGAKVIHTANNSSSKIVMKSISSGGGKSTYRGLVKVLSNAKNIVSAVSCDALIMDNNSVSETYPTMEIGNNRVTISHEASVGKIDEEKIFYLVSRGITKDEAMSMIVNGFIDPVIKSLPIEYAVEMNRLIEMEMEKSVG